MIDQQTHRELLWQRAKQEYFAGFVAGFSFAVLFCLFSNAFINWLWN